MLPWKRAQAGKVLRQLAPVAVLAFAIGALVFAIQTGRSALVPVGAALGIWVFGGACLDLWTRTGRGELAGRFARLTRLPRADWGKATAHAGLGVTLFAVAAMTGWATEVIKVVRIGESFDLSGYQVKLVEVHEEKGPNYLSTKAEMAVTRNGKPVSVLFPEKRVYPVQAMPTTEAALDYGLFRDIYLVIGDPQVGGGYAVRGYWKPFANWLWIGAGLMALGGLLSLTDRRYRVAAGARNARAVPAE
jgi:cytochrome c-type biogenesis protein CcmF